MILILLVCGLLAGVQSRSSKLVNISQGPVLGYKANDADVFQFYGIPYATAPKGRDRFKGPLPPPVWTETLEAVHQNIVCPHYDEGTDCPHCNGSRRKRQINNVTEDCLVANVLVPDTDAKNLPVMVSVHGGAFQGLSGNFDRPTQLVNSKRVIAVTFNYRLGPQGFLCLGTEEIPGNAGMKDQVELLRWVQKNIRNFGGNPDDVTIVGCSAGGASVDLLMLSKMTNGLFHRAIAMSGSNVGVFGAQANPIENARNYAKNINYTGSDDFDSLVEFYKTVPLDQLYSHNLLETRDLAVVFQPCVEKDLGGERFLDDTPVNILKKGDYVRYPLLYGFANMEGIFRTRFFESWSNGMNANFSEFLPADLGFKDTEEKAEIAQAIKEFYFGDRPVGEETGLQFVDYFTDAMFVYAMHRSVTLQVQAGNTEVYFFVYSFVHENSHYVPYSNIQGADHCDHGLAVMDEDESRLAPEYRDMKHKMREVWLDFITTGNPTPPGSSVPKWEPSGDKRFPLMEFGNTIKVTGPFEEKRMKFWDNIYNHFHLQPVQPYRF